MFRLVPNNLQSKLDRLTEPQTGASFFRGPPKNAVLALVSLNHKMGTLQKRHTLGACIDSPSSRARRFSDFGQSKPKVTHRSSCCPCPENTRLAPDPKLHQGERESRAARGNYHISLGFQKVPERNVSVCRVLWYHGNQTLIPMAQRMQGFGQLILGGCFKGPFWLVVKGNQREPASIDTRKPNRRKARRTRCSIDRASLTLKAS